MEGLAFLNKPLPNNRAGQKTCKKIPAVILPEGYIGKVLLISVSGAGLETTIILRSGDLWHREILHNTRAEIRRLGFDHVQVNELGGAHLRFESDGSILIHGTSQQYGSCDKEFAARLVRDKFPGRRVEIR
jgi:hypothetical protein